MRVVDCTLEYIINCQCKLIIAYKPQEIGGAIPCPKCGCVHHLNGSHPISLFNLPKHPKEPWLKLLETPYNDHGSYI